MSNIALVTRNKEEPFLHEFCRYYLSQGVDQIYVLDDNSTEEYRQSLFHHAKIEYRLLDDPEKNIDEEVDRLYKRIRRCYDWVIYVDVDEYITTKRNSHLTIKDELETTFKDVACIKVPWVMMSSNSRKKNPESLLQDNIYRWNHDVTHVNSRSSQRKFRCRYEEIEVKCIFRPKFFRRMYYHHPVPSRIAVLRGGIKVVDGVNKNIDRISAYYNCLREDDIRNGYLLCYHYRIVSIENCLNKLQNNKFYRKFDLDDLMSTDYSEIKDETMRRKSILTL
ncbi:glycosyltransferase family 2 protein [Synechococcus sp. CS-1332]|uniref:glycosyltransferase family 2 protein n=1 Tax=Synechococcus sp. CS-1332 TaxID=2847972 RepID=UPI00223A7B1E|nr:glycosyltransferase family 2 protein [Synechococcus sp. CS-1332]MCT0206974.1 glycosyltransferase family 2 protein [Synechococcus sp. CS-1332]